MIVSPDDLGESSHQGYETFRRRIEWSIKLEYTVPKPRFSARIATIERFHLSQGGLLVSSPADTPRPSRNTSKGQQNFFLKGYISQLVNDVNLRVPDFYPAQEPRRRNSMGIGPMDGLDEQVTARR